MSTPIDAHLAEDCNSAEGQWADDELDWLRQAVALALLGAGFGQRCRGLGLLRQEISALAGALGDHRVAVGIIDRLAAVLAAEPSAQAAPRPPQPTRISGSDAVARLCRFRLRLSWAIVGTAEFRRQRRSRRWSKALRARFCSVLQADRRDDPARELLLKRLMIALAAEAGWHPEHGARIELPLSGEEIAALTADLGCAKMLFRTQILVRRATWELIKLLAASPPVLGKGRQPLFGAGLLAVPLPVLGKGDQPLFGAGFAWQPVAERL